MTPIPITDNSERGFQKLIVKELVENGRYLKSVSHEFDREFCINSEQLYRLNEHTQPEKYNLIRQKGERKFLLRLDKKIKEKGIIETLASSIYPLPVSEGGSLEERFFDFLEAIIKEFNTRHGDIEWTEQGKVNKILFQEIPDQLQEDEDTIETLKNSDKQNAKISMDKKILDLMQDLMFSHTEIYKKFVDDPDFKRRYQEFIFDIVWQRTQNPNTGERPSL